jgi:SAM-dependent methyltransferase
VVREIEGMRSEHPGRYPTLESFHFQPVEQVSRLEDRIRGEGATKNYYQSTELNVRYAFDRLPLTGSEVVLEVGAEHDFPFLEMFRERGCECYATNLFFCYEAGGPPGARVVLGDMNRLPFRDGTFDVVLLSATSHHSPDLPGLMAELSRVTRPGGWVLLLNDPTLGLFKHALDRFGMGTRKGGDRHSLVNENEYPVSAYRRLARRSGFDLAESFFSVYYDMKLRSGQVSGVRFAPLAKLVSRLWQLDFLRSVLSRAALYPGQMLIGLELNLILRRRSR